MCFERIRFAVIILIASINCGSVAFAAQDCESLGKLTLPHVSITRAESVPAGNFTPPIGRPIRDLPPFCRVSGVSKPSADSNIGFEVWMPISKWNGKFHGVGNGGFAGEINYGQMGIAVAHGYATASTDTGHQGGSTDARWALEHPEKIVDFGHRAIHETAVTAKRIIQAFYGESPKRSYFSSCSNGGRQALMEAQRYPEDYDGIIAGAPAYDWTHLLASSASNMKTLLKEKESYIPAQKLSTIQSAALASCDTLDGVKDGVIENPSRCHFNPSILQCQGAATDSCLTTPQVVALKKLYDGTRMSNGSQLFPGYALGGEAEHGGWEPWITGAAPERSLMFAFATQFFKNMVFNNPEWDFRTFNVDRDTKAADKKMAPILNAANPDLSRFHARGGKLILYHGWSDAAIPAQSTIDYYENAVKKMSAERSQKFVRLFMVPGMQHCSAGSGPNNFGQGGAGSGDPDRNIDAALERWVEQEIAPERITATKYKNNSDSKSEVVRTRPLCAYPLTARYKGIGSTDDAANFICAKPQP